jgi:hypothetical protein
MTKDGRWKMPFILRGPVLYDSQAPNGKSCIGPEPSTTGPDLLSHIRVSGLGYKSMSSSGLGFPLSRRNTFHGLPTAISFMSRFESRAAI